MKHFFNSESDEIKFLLPEVKIEIPANTFSEAVNIAKEGADGIVPRNATDKEVVEIDNKFFLVFSPLIHIESQLYSKGCCATCWIEQDNNESCDCGRKLCELCIHRYELAKKRNWKSLWLKKKIVAITRISGACKNVVWNRENNIDFTAEVLPSTVSAEGGTAQRRMMRVRRIGNQLIFQDVLADEKSETEDEGFDEDDLKHLEETADEMISSIPLPVGSVVEINDAGTLSDEKMDADEKQDETVISGETENPDEEISIPEKKTLEESEDDTAVLDLKSAKESEKISKMLSTEDDSKNEKTVDEQLKELADLLEPVTHCCECTPGEHFEEPHLVHVQYPDCGCDESEFVLSKNGQGESLFVEHEDEVKKESKKAKKSLRQRTKKSDGEKEQTKKSEDEKKINETKSEDEK